MKCNTSIQLDLLVGWIRFYFYFCLLELTWSLEGSSSQNRGWCPCIWKRKTLQALCFCDDEAHGLGGVLQLILLIPYYTSIRTAGKCHRLVLEAAVQKCCLRIRLQTENGFVYIVQPQPLQNKIPIEALSAISSAKIKCWFRLK